MSYRKCYTNKINIGTYQRWHCSCVGIGVLGGEVDQGVQSGGIEAMVIMDKKEYMDKAIGLLSDTNIYRTITKDPTDKLKNKLIGILKDIKQTSGLKDSTYHKMYPTSVMVSPKSTK